MAFNTPLSLCSRLPRSLPSPHCRPEEAGSTTMFSTKLTADDMVMCIHTFSKPYFGKSLTLPGYCVIGEWTGTPDMSLCQFRPSILKGKKGRALA